MHHHSTVGLVTNSSSEVYINPLSSFSEDIWIAAQTILDAAGVDAKAADVFDLVGEKLVNKNNGASIHIQGLFEDLYYVDADYNG